MTTVTEPQPDAHVALDASSKPETSETLACTAPLEVDAGDVSEQTFQCCVADVQSAVGDASLWGDPNGPDASVVSNDPSAENCCKAIVARMDNEPDGGNLSNDYMAASQVLNWCCIALGYPSGPACTPWGPPTPPAMEVA